MGGWDLNPRSLCLYLQSAIPDSATPATSARESKTLRNDDWSLIPTAPCENFEIPTSELTARRSASELTGNK